MQGHIFTWMLEVEVSFYFILLSCKQNSMGNTIMEGSWIHTSLIQNWKHVWFESKQFIDLRITKDHLVEWVFGNFPQNIALLEWFYFLKYVINWDTHKKIYEREREKKKTWKKLIWTTSLGAPWTTFEGYIKNCHSYEEVKGGGNKCSMMLQVITQYAIHLEIESKEWWCFPLVIKLSILSYEVKLGPKLQSPSNWYNLKWRDQCTWMQAIW